mmetsp:Transcript_366/g.831  ORF Transcript_366/g.831 Transcript_366/m.831 type:complete len:236 (-) Transcript_366:93-800(-)
MPWPLQQALPRSEPRGLAVVHEGKLDSRVVDGGHKERPPVLTIAHLIQQVLELAGLPTKEGGVPVHHAGGRHPLVRYPSRAVQELHLLQDDIVRANDRKACVLLGLLDVVPDTSLDVVEPHLLVHQVVQEEVSLRVEPVMLVHPLTEGDRIGSVVKFKAGRSVALLLRLQFDGHFVVVSRRLCGASEILSVGDFNRFGFGGMSDAKFDLGISYDQGPCLSNQIKDLRGRVSGSIS